MALTIGALLAVSAPVRAEEAAFVQEFADAHREHLMLKMASIIEENRDKVVGEIEALLKANLDPDISADDREGNFYIAELLARSYNELTGDPEPLKKVKQRVFDARLPAEIVSKATDGVNTVEFPPPDAEARNLFSPGNIVIRQGEKVRWVNNDDEAHIFATMPLIGMSGIKSPSVAAGESWEYKFDKPGKYYLICFIHRGMISKVTVLGKDEPPAAPETAAATEPAQDETKTGTPTGESAETVATDAPSAPKQPCSAKTPDDTDEGKPKVKKKKKKSWWRR